MIRRDYGKVGIGLLESGHRVPQPDPAVCFPCPSLLDSKSSKTAVRPHEDNVFIGRGDLKRMADSPIVSLKHVPATVGDALSRSLIGSGIAERETAIRSPRDI